VGIYIAGVDFLHFGIDGRDGDMTDRQKFALSWMESGTSTLVNLGNALGITREGARQLVERAKRAKMREAVELERLKNRRVLSRSSSSRRKEVIDVGKDLVPGAARG